MSVIQPDPPEESSSEHDVATNVKTLNTSADNNLILLFNWNNELEIEAVATCNQFLSRN